MKKSSKKFPPISSLVRWNDHHFIIMDKPAGMPVQPDPTNDMSLQQLGQMYSKRKLNLVTRLDRPAQGLVIFAKDAPDAQYMQKLMTDQKLHKSYLVIVEGLVEHDKKTLKHFLFHNKSTHKAIIEDTKSEQSKESILHYEVIQKLENYTALKVQIETGRFHQIRAQMAHIGHPVKGDIKYGGRRKNEDRSIYLCAYEIKFKSKASHKLIHCMAELSPEDTLWSQTITTLNG